MDKMITLSMEEYNKLLWQISKKTAYQIFWTEVFVYDKDFLIKNLVEQIDIFKKDLEEYKYNSYKKISEEIEKDFLHRKWIWYFLMWVVSTQILNAVISFIF